MSSATADSGGSSSESSNYYSKEEMRDMQQQDGDYWAWGDVFDGIGVEDFTGSDLGWEDAVGALFGFI